MKKTVLWIMVVIGVFVGTKDYYSNHYEKTGEITTHIECGDGRTVNDRFIVIDELGHEWEFTSGHNYKKGDKVLVKFYTNHTETQFDDEIVRIKTL